MRLKFSPKNFRRQMSRKARFKFPDGFWEANPRGMIRIAVFSFRPYYIARFGVRGKLEKNCKRRGKAYSGRKMPNFKWKIVMRSVCGANFEVISIRSEDTTNKRFWIAFFMIKKYAFNLPKYFINILTIRKIVPFLTKVKTP